MGISLISDPATQSALELAISNVFTTFMRPFSLYVEAQKAYISTNPNDSRFGQHDQNTFHPTVTPQVYTVTGTIYYPNRQPWDYIAPENRSNYDQTKIRNQGGQVRIKVDGTGYALMQQVKLIQLDGFEFKLTSSARPHGVFTPQRWTLYLDKVD